MRVAPKPQVRSRLRPAWSIGFATLPAEMTVRLLLPAPPQKSFCGCRTLHKRLPGKERVQIIALNKWEVQPLLAFKRTLTLTPVRPFKLSGAIFIINRLLQQSLK